MFRGRAYFSAGESTLMWYAAINEKATRRKAGTRSHGPLARRGSRATERGLLHEFCHATYQGYGRTR
jgi:hypothetical protein